jgi:hypothetical protein
VRWVLYSLAEDFPVLAALVSVSSDSRGERSLDAAFGSAGKRPLFRICRSLGLIIRSRSDGSRLGGFDDGGHFIGGLLFLRLSEGSNRDVGGDNHATDCLDTESALVRFVLVISRGRVLFLRQVGRGLGDDLRIDRGGCLGFRLCWCG